MDKLKRWQLQVQEGQLQFKKEFERYIEANGYSSIHALVAFTDKITLEDEETGVKKDYTSIGMNTNGKGLPYGFTDEDDYIREVQEIRKKCKH